MCAARAGQLLPSAVLRLEWSWSPAYAADRGSGITSLINAPAPEGSSSCNEGRVWGQSASSCDVHHVSTTNGSFASIRFRRGTLSQRASSLRDRGMLLLRAVGSRIFPLTWLLRHGLPAPTPVSAADHAAPMVTAGGRVRSCAPARSTTCSPRRAADPWPSVGAITRAARCA